MVLPDVVALCDAVELAAIVLDVRLFEADLAKQFFPGQTFSDVEAEIRDVLNLAKARREAVPSEYPFDVTDRSIYFTGSGDFSSYTFLLLGRTLNFGGPADSGRLLGKFRRHFEDVLCWALRRAGWTAEVLSVPRGFRGLDSQLIPALRQISTRFRGQAILQESALMPDDNDLDVDVLAAPLPGNSTRGGWPCFQIQCSTGKVEELDAKLNEGAKTFCGVWADGFSEGCRVRAIATPVDLLKLHPNHWARLGRSGWVIDRTRIAHLSAGSRAVPLLPEVSVFWGQLWKARLEIDWQTGWQA